MKRTFWEKHYQKIIGGIIFCGFARLISEFSWWAVCAFIVLVIAVLFSHWLQWRIAKARNSKDFAFAVFLTPAYKNPVRDRLKRHFPKMCDEEIDSWISEFTAAQEEMGSLASAGGIKILGKEFVVERLQKKFHFLVGYGLKRALNSIVLEAMRDGYERNPLLKREDLLG